MSPGASHPENFTLEELIKGRTGASVSDNLMKMFYGNFDF